MRRGGAEEKEKDHRKLNFRWSFGPSVEIRTRGLLNPIQARYQTSPHPDIHLCCNLNFQRKSERAFCPLRLVRVSRFELEASWTPFKRDTKLRHTRISPCLVDS